MKVARRLYLRTTWQVSLLLESGGLLARSWGKEGAEMTILYFMVGFVFGVVFGFLFSVGMCP